MKLILSTNPRLLVFICIVVTSVIITSADSQLNFGESSDEANEKTSSGLIRLGVKILAGASKKSSGNNNEYTYPRSFYRGHSHGHSDGHSHGHSDGHSHGHSDGHSHGHSDGHSHGHSHGHGHHDIIPQSFCVLKADPGFCNLMVGRWYFDHRYHRCLPFMYTGCGGNTNNFVSIKRCEEATKKCHYYGSPDPVSKYSLLNSNPLNPLGALARSYVLAG